MSGLISTRLVYKNRINGILVYFCEKFHMKPHRKPFHVNSRVNGKFCIKFSYQAIVLPTLAQKFTHILINHCHIISLQNTLKDETCVLSSPYYLYHPHILGHINILQPNIRSMNGINLL